MWSAATYILARCFGQVCNDVKSNHFNETMDCAYRVQRIAQTVHPSSYRLTLVILLRPRFTMLSCKQAQLYLAGWDSVWFLGDSTSQWLEEHDVA